LHKGAEIINTYPCVVLTSVYALPATYAKVVHYPNDAAAGGVICKLYRASGNASLAIHAIFFDGFNDWS
jgi:hypothetical protein